MKVLIVEDNQNDRRLLTLNLEKHGSTVVEASDGRAGLALARQHQPDLIISDALMPKMDGFEFLRSVKQDDVLYSIPFVFYSAVYTGAKEEELALSLGADAFVVKPLEPEVFWQRLQEILQQCEQRRHHNKKNLLVEEEQYLREYSSVVAAKLEEKVRELERSKTRIIKSERRYKNFFNSVRDVIIIGDENRTIIDCNQPALREVFGYEREEIIGENAQVIYAEKKDYQQAGREFFDAGNIVPGKIIKTHFRRRDGSTFVGEMSSFRILDQGGHVEWNAGLIRDITEQNQLATQLMQAQKMEAIGTLAGGVAHDFNNILSVILGYLNLSMSQLQPDHPVLPDLQEVEKAAQRASGVVNQLLLFSRIEPIKTSIIDLNESIEHLFKMLQRFIGEDIRLERELAPDLWHVEGDISQLDQITMNLMVNAKDAMPDGGRIIIKTENICLDEDFCAIHGEARPGNFVRLSITDTGRGMDEKTQQHMFDPFFTTKEIGKGTGLGLTVAYGVVKEHDGWINVYSVSGRGTTFRIYLPATPSDELDEGDVGAHVLQDVRGQGERILLVEDEGAIRRLVTKILEKNNYHVFAAGNGKEAEELFSQQQGNFDLIMCDVVLPDTSGVKLVTDLLARRSGFSVLFCSGYADDKSQWPVIRERGFPFIAKPFIISELLGEIKAALGK